METQPAVVGAILFILLILVSNFVMVAIARGAAGGDSRWMSALRDSLRKPMEGASTKAMDELREKVAELGKNKKEN